MARTVAEAATRIKPERDAAARLPDEGAFALVCACLAPGDGPLPVDRPDDTGLLARIARRHQVSGLVAARLSKAGRNVPPALQRRAQQSRRLALGQMAALLELAQQLDEAGCEAAFLKGVALSQQIHGSPLLRYAADIDVLVRPGQVASAWQVLAALGYRRKTPAQLLDGARLALYCWASKDSIHVHPDSKVTVELHWRLADDLHETGLPPSTRLAAVELAPGRTVAVLGAADQFLYLCVHGAAHGWARLKWLADVAALLHAAPDRGIALWREAAARGGRIAAASAILLSGELFGLTPPPGFTPPRSPRLRLLLALARWAIRDGGGARELESTPWRGWTELVAKSLVAPGVLAQLTVFRRLALSGEDIAQVALPPALFWLYPLLRIPLLLRRRLTRAERLRGRGREDNNRA